MSVLLTSASSMASTTGATLMMRHPSASNALSACSSCAGSVGSIRLDF